MRAVTVAFFFLSLYGSGCFAEEAPWPSQAPNTYSLRVPYAKASLRPIPEGVELPADVTATTANYCFRDINADGQSDLFIAFGDYRDSASPRQLVYFRVRDGYTLAADLERCFQIDLLESHAGAHQLATWERGAPSVFVRRLFRFDGKQLVLVRSQEIPVSQQTYKDRYVPEPKKP